MPGRSDNDLVEVWIVRPPREGRTQVLIFNGYEEVAEHSIRTEASMGEREIKRR